MKKAIVALARRRFAMFGCCFGLVQQLRSGNFISVVAQCGIGDCHTFGYRLLP
jgi:hypothetical protein